MAEQSALVPVVSYARISADTKRDGRGVKDQHEVNRETAAQHGWTAVHQYTDNDKSAARLDVARDAFEDMLKALKAGKLPDGTEIRGVVVVADDRLARRPGDYERFLDAFTHNEGFVFADAKQEIDLYNEDAETMGLIGVVFSKKEVRRIARRTRQGHRRRAEQGIPVGGHRPFGWKWDRVTLEPAEAELIRSAAQQFIAGRGLHRERVAAQRCAEAARKPLDHQDHQGDAGARAQLRMAGTPRRAGPRREWEPGRRHLAAHHHP
nr:recombinase family protein [Microbispora sp. H13382]